MATADEKMASGEWRVPALRMASGGYAWNISKPRKGYDAQPRQGDLVAVLVYTANANSQP